MFTCGRFSMVSLCFAIAAASGLLPSTENVCQNNGDCVNGYCQAGMCICNKGWWGHFCQYCRLRYSSNFIGIFACLASLPFSLRLPRRLEISGKLCVRMNSLLDEKVAFTNNPPIRNAEVVPSRARSTDIFYRL